MVFRLSPDHGTQPAHHPHAQVEVECPAAGKGRHPLQDVPQAGAGVQHLSRTRGHLQQKVKACRGQAQPGKMVQQGGGVWR